jgi:hypothetical protein
MLTPFKTRFALRLINRYDGDMINMFNEDGTRISPYLLGVREPEFRLGKEYSQLLKRWNCTHAAPFSCNHVYSRSDSIWASTYETPYDSHGIGFDSRAGEFVPGYFNYNASTKITDVAEPGKRPRVISDPSAFGDDWNATLSAADAQTRRARISPGFPIYAGGSASLTCALARSIT